MPRPCAGSTIVRRGRHAAPERGVSGPARTRPSSCSAGPRRARRTRDRRGCGDARARGRRQRGRSRPGGVAGARAHRAVRLVAAGRLERRAGAGVGVGVAPRLGRAPRARRRSSRGRPFGVSLFRQAQFGGAFVNLGGVDGLGRWVRLRSGRLPRRCTPQRCELVLVGGSGRLPRLPFLHVVGRGTLTKDAPLCAYFGNRGASAPPLLLAEGALALGQRAASRRRADRAHVRLGAADRAGVAARLGDPGARAPRRPRGRSPRGGRSGLQRHGAARLARVGAREGARRRRAAPADRRRRRRAVARVRRSRGGAAAARHRRRAAAADVVGSALVAARDVHRRGAGARRVRRGLRRLGRRRRSSQRCWRAR